MSKCCKNCDYHKSSELKIQFNEIPITAYCANKDSQYYDKYVWDDDICGEWEGSDQGEWLPFEFGDERWHKCSCCGTADKYIEYVPRPNGTVGKLVSIRNFCPNCGARMFAKDINVPNKKGADDE